MPTRALTETTDEFLDERDSIHPYSGKNRVAMRKERPEIRLARWNRENPLGVHYPGIIGAAQRNGEYIVWGSGNQQVHSYQLDPIPNAEDGALELEVYLVTKPLVNIFDFTLIGHEQYTWYFQPPLNEDPVAEVWPGVVSRTPTETRDINGNLLLSRPINVVNSYAVYHSDRKNHRSNSVNYGAGKAFHIFRPKAIDINGNAVWCDLSYRQASGVLRVRVPQNFLDNATYPIRIDPTFGLTSIGGSNTGAVGANRIVGSFATPTEAGTITSISAYIDGAVGNLAGAAIYASSGSAPTTKLAEDSGNATLGDPAAWATTNLSYAFSASTQYYLLSWVNASRSMQYDSGASNQGYQSDASYTFETWPTNPSPSSGLAILLSIYATYDVPAGSVSQVILVN